MIPSVSPCAVFRSEDCFFSYRNLLELANVYVLRRRKFLLLDLQFPGMVKILWRRGSQRNMYNFRLLDMSTSYFFFQSKSQNSSYLSSRGIYYSSLELLDFSFHAQDTVTCETDWLFSRGCLIITKKEIPLRLFELFLIRRVSLII